MNCPSRVDGTEGHADYNQQPPHLPADLTTNSDMNNIKNMRRRSDASRGGIKTFDISSGDDPGSDLAIEDASTSDVAVGKGGGRRRRGSSVSASASNAKGKSELEQVAEEEEEDKTEKKAFSKTVRVMGASAGKRPPPDRAMTPDAGFWAKTTNFVFKYARFMGPGFMISVSYMDPGNYSTDVAAGAAFKYSHLFVIFLSNVLAIFLQSLSVKLGSVTGVDLAENCKRNLPKWLNLILYLLAESAIIATDIAEVIGSAIALNILLKIPLVAGCAITSLDVFIVLFFYNSNGPVKHIRFFEIFVACLVFGVIICFGIELANIKDTSAAEVFRGYLPSKTIATGNGLYLSCGILGATVMPHSLFLGSGIVQARMKDYDNFYSNSSTATVGTTDSSIIIPERKYKPSVDAIKNTMGFCIADMAISLFTCALFANSAILIVSGATLSNTPDAQDADLFSIYNLLKENLGKAAGILFAVALFFSGESAGVVVTLAGQMISEGFLNWRVKPWIRRLITRAIAILPSIVVAGAVGRSGLAEVLNASQVALSILLPFVSAPLIYLTCRTRYMSVEESISTAEAEASQAGEAQHVQTTDAENTIPTRRTVDFSNGWITSTLAIVIWGFMAALNSYLIITLAMGKNQG